MFTKTSVHHPPPATATNYAPDAFADNWCGARGFTVLSIGDESNNVDVYFTDADDASRWLRDALAAVANARTGR